MVKWCKENAVLSGLADAPIRYITDDCLKFVRREIKRGRKYDAIIMDPPTYGRGSTGEMWKLEDHLWELLNECKQVLSDQPVFFLINAYTARLSPTSSLIYSLPCWPVPAAISLGAKSGYLFSRIRKFCPAASSAAGQPSEHTLQNWGRWWWH
jgi:hypothetical protein